MINIKSMINVVIPMAGLGSRFSEAGFLKPKPFIDVLDSPMIEKVIQNLNIVNAKYFLIAQSEHLLREKQIVDKIKEKYNVTFIAIDKLTEGTACTILYAKQYIDNELPLLIANSDQIVDINMNDFINDAKNKSLFGSILTFIDETMNPKWSFVKKNDSGFVEEVKEKVAISSEATVGIYYFEKGSYFVNAAIQMIIENDRVNNEFYTCPVYSYMIKNEMKIGTYRIPFVAMHGIGTPEDLKTYVDSFSK